MKKEVLPLEEVSISGLFNSSDRSVFEVPIYQRNYAWEKDEISALIQDVYDSFKNKLTVYYIGTLVSYNRGDRLYEIIDGQQRLTTIRLILGVLGVVPRNRLTYRARKKSDDTIASIPKFDRDELDNGITNGYRFAKSAIDDIVPDAEKSRFIAYFLNNVHIIHYQVPRDIDLNHYFEVMNSRGEQLEKHEIIKARLLSKLDDPNDRAVFNAIWESCSNMGVYIQQTLPSALSVFGNTLCEFLPDTFRNIRLFGVGFHENRKSIEEIITTDNEPDADEAQGQAERPDSFQPIIDFTNFLLTVLKLTLISDQGFSPQDFLLDDKELINEFDKVETKADFVREYGYNLLKAKFFLDNYLVHHSNEDDTIDNNPWKLEKRQKDADKKKGYLKNLFDDPEKQLKAIHLLSMFEVSFTARQRKNYLFYCLLYLFTHDSADGDGYLCFLRNLAEKYFSDVYLISNNLNAINTPLPGSFDAAVLKENKLDLQVYSRADAMTFAKVYGDGTVQSKGVPLYIFNYIDYKLWEKYALELRGEASRDGSAKRNAFFRDLGCSDFGLSVFDQFYFSRTRRSLEHYYPQALANGEIGRPNEDQINCLGNYAMIGSEINSSGSDWSPKSKLDHYLDASGKIKQVSVSSLKFMIMMQMCKDNQSTRENGQEWNFNDIQTHQRHLMSLLFGENTQDRDIGSL